MAAYDWQTPFYNWGTQPEYSGQQALSNWNTGGASAATRGAASQLMNGNVGTQFANAFGRSADQSAAAGLRSSLNQSMLGGGAGNYNAISGLTANAGAQSNAAKGEAFVKGAAINQQGLEAGGNLSAKADELDQQGKHQAEQYSASLRPEEFGGFAQAMQQRTQNQEGLWPGLGKGLLAGGLGLLTGGLAGGLTSGIENLFGGSGQSNEPSGPPKYGPYSPTYGPRGPHL